MKKIVFIGILCLSLFHFKAHAQEYSEGSYYQNSTSIEDVPIGQPYNEYNGYGQFIGVYQQWERAVWHSTSGGEYVNVWDGDEWVSQWYTGTYWWYNWVVYIRRVG